MHRAAHASARESKSQRDTPLYGGCKTSVEGLENKMIKSREGLLLEGDVEGDVKEGGSGEGDVEAEEGEL